MEQLLYKNKSIFYRVSGKGKPVFLVHGFGEDGRIWDEISGTLSEHYRIIVPDLPGSGKSQMLDGPCTMKDYALVINAIAAKETGGEPFTLIGHSMGGYITLAYAEDFPENLNALGLFHSSPFADTDEKKEARKKSIAFISENGAEEFLKTAVPDLFSEKNKKENPEIIEKLFLIAKTLEAPALMQYTDAMMKRPDRTSILENIEKPVLFIIGKHDSLIPLDTSLKFCSLASTSAIHILKNSGHEGMLEEPQLSTTYLKGFLHTFCE